MAVPASVIYYYPIDSGDTSPVSNQGSASHNLQLTGGGITTASGQTHWGGSAWGTATGTDSSRPTFSGEITISAWIRTTDATSGADLLSLFNGYVGLTNGSIIFWEPPGFASTSTAIINDGDWHHVAVDRWADGNRHIWIDGVLDATWFSAILPTIGGDGWGVSVGTSGLYGVTASVDFDDIVVSNTVLYTTNFTPAARGSAFSESTPPGELSGSSTLSTITSTGTLEASFGFAGASTLANVTSTGTMTASSPVYLTGGTAVLDSVVSDGSFGLLDPVSLVGASTLAAITSSGTLSVVSVPTMQIVAAMPAPVVSMRSGATVTAVMPSPVAQVVMSQPPVMSITASMPYTASAHGGATVRAVQGYTASMAMTAPAIMRVEASIRYEASLTARTTERMGIVASLPMPVVSMHGGAQIVASMPMPVVSAAMTASATMQVVASMPMPVASLEATTSAVMQITAVMPAPVPLASARIVAVMPGYTSRAELSHAFTPTYEAYVLNLNQPLDDNPRNNFEAKVPQMTRYTDWPFVQVARVAGEHYAVGPSGIYRLGGTTNDGAPIDWSFETCMTDFGDPHRKTVASAYLSGRCPAELTYTLRSGDDTDWLYDYITTRTTQKRNHRQKFGLGRRVRYYSFGLAGQGELAMDGLEFEVIGTTRRV